MLKKMLILVSAGMLLVSLVSCKKDTPQPPQQPVQQPLSQQQPVTGQSGRVAEAAAADGYSFVLVETGASKFWAAAPEFPVKVGDSVTVPEGTAMTNYRSKGLNREFEQVLFVDAIAVNSGTQSNPALPPAAGHP